MGKCKNCGKQNAAVKHPYCRSCQLEFRAWLGDADAIVKSHHWAGKVDFYGYEDTPSNSHDLL